MGMRGQAVVGVGDDLMVGFASLTGRVHVDNDIPEMGKVMERLVPHL